MVMLRMTMAPSDRSLPHQFIEMPKAAFGRATQTEI
jgi:hypothetical protein